MLLKIYINQGSEDGSTWAMKIFKHDQHQYKLLFALIIIFIFEMIIPLQLVGRA